MTMHLPRFGLALVIFATVTTPLARAGPIIAGSTDLIGTAIQDITLLPNTPFNQSSSAILIKGVSGYGTITLNRDAQTGSTINFLSLAGGMYFGSNASLGSYVFGNVAPLTGADFNGSITNVVQNSGDPGFATGQPSSFQSGDFSFGGNSFGFKFLSGPAAGITLFTDPAVPFRFGAHFDGLPPSAGTVLMNTGPDVLNVLYGGSVVALSSNRTIVLGAVPEPASFVMLGSGVLLTLGYARGRKARCINTGR